MNGTVKAKFDTSFVLSSKLLIILIIFGISLLMYVFHLGFFAFIGFISGIFLLYRYRNPERYIYRDDNEILSPIDGVVCAIDFQNNTYKIYIENRISDVCILRMPEDGRFKVIEDRKGCNVEPFSPKAIMLNDKAILQFLHCKIELFGGIVASAIELYNQQFSLSKGDRIGLFGGGLVVLEVGDFLPIVKLGEELYAGQSVVCKKAFEEA